MDQSAPTDRFVQGTVLWPIDGNLRARVLGHADPWPPGMKLESPQCSGSGRRLLGRGR